MWLVPALLTTCAGGGPGAQGDGFRATLVETEEMTAPDVAVSPDGEHLAFTVLGQLFLVPVGGGRAEQLTFGPHQHDDPAFAPDGRTLAFASNRDGTDGNVFVLDLASRSISRVTDEVWAGRPAWSPSGDEIAYLRFGSRGGHCPTGEALVCRIPLGGAPETLASPDGPVRSVFYLPDGRVAWSVHERGGQEGHDEDHTRIDVRAADGSISTFTRVDGILDRTLPAVPGNGLVARCRTGAWAPEYLIVFEPGKDVSRVASLSPQACFYASGGFALAPDGTSAYLGDRGRLWSVSLADGAREPVPVRARVELEVQAPTPPRTATFARTGRPLEIRSIVEPALLSDGSSLVFGAVGQLWLQRSDAGPAERLTRGDGYARQPVPSPDGRRLLYLWSKAWRQEVRCLDLETGDVRALAGGSYYWDPAWSPDGRRVVFGESSPQGLRLTVIDLDGQAKRAFEVGGLDSWTTRPQFTPDGSSLLYAAFTSGLRSVHRLPLDGTPEPEAITALDRHLADPLLSPDGRWLAFRRNAEIWLASLESTPVVETAARRVSAVGGHGFGFAPDGRSLVYAEGARVWRHDLAADERERLPVRLDLECPTPPPLLLQDVRVLDLDSGEFGGETTMYVEGGRIRRIGDEGDREPHADAVVLECAGRYAIPGLADLHMHNDANAEQRVGFQEAWIAFGVTSVREVGGDLAWVASLADRAEATSEPLPRFFFAGDILHGVNPGPRHDPISVHDADEARALVRLWDRLGVDLIKTHPDLSWPMQRAVAEEARQAGLPVSEHGYPLDALLRSVTLGAAFVEHRGRYYDDVFRLLAKTGTRWNLTLGMTGADVVFDRDDPARWLDARTRAFAADRVVREMKTFGSTDDMRTLVGFRQGVLRVVREARERGVRLHLGTDAPLWIQVPGASLHAEMAAFVDGGYTSLEVLRLATVEAAEALGTSRDLGTLAVGKLADVVLLDEDPLEDIAGTRSIWRVVKGGWIHDPDELRPERN